MFSRQLMSRRLWGAAACGVTGALWLKQQQAWAAGPPFDVKRIRAEVEKIIEENQAGPVFVRLAWHAAGTYDKASGTGGNKGTMRYSPEKEHGANAGLEIARGLLEPVKASNPGISYADLWCLASLIAIEEAGGPKVPFRWGRQDAPQGEANKDDTRLPGADKEGSAGVKHTRDIFGRMGFNDREMIALFGAHALGHCHKDRSGFVGPWTHDPYSFTNEYFRLLLEYKWRVKPGSSPQQYEDENTKTLMMTPIEISWKTDPTFLKYINEYAADSDKFFADFSLAYQKLMELGAPPLNPPLDY